MYSLFILLTSKDYTVARIKIKKKTDTKYNPQEKYEKVVHSNRCSISLPNKDMLYNVCIF